MRVIACLLLALLSLSLWAEPVSSYDTNAPMGWCVTASREGGTYTMTGGEGGRQTTLYGDAGDIRQALVNALKTYDIVILDGSRGDFVFSRSASIQSFKNKTIVGINNARLCTEFFVTPEIVAALDAADVKSLSSSAGTGGTLSNGVYVSERCEQVTRQTIIDMTGDESEAYRNAGVLSVSRCENIIIRNLTFVGPGPIDVGGSDLITCTKTKHLWVDHCAFIDGMDGNVDITQQSDLVSVTWCTFSYTDRAYDHALSNLIGSSDTSPDSLLLNVTFANCVWGKGVHGRTPMVRHGKIHLLNSLWQCVGSVYPINPRCYASTRMEGCYFDEGMKKIFRAGDDAAGWQWVDCSFVESYSPVDNGEVVLPYTYEAYPSALVPSVLLSSNGAGPTLSAPLMIGRTTDTQAASAATCLGKTLLEGQLLIRRADGCYDILGRPVR